MGQCWSSAGLKEPNELISVWDDRCVKLCATVTFGEHKQHFLSKFNITMNILGLPIFWSFWNRFRVQPMIYLRKKKKKARIKHKPHRHLTCSFFEGCLWRGHDFHWKKKKVKLLKPWVSLYYQCYGFGITSQLPCGTYSLVALGWVRAYGTEKCSPASAL